jgi:uncharacterized protein (TIGR02099 family)
MSNDHFTPALAAQRAAVYWRFLRSCYRFANLASHHLLGALVKLVVVAYFLFGLTFLGLRYVVLPNIDHYKPEVEQIASRVIGQPVTIDTIYASWQGLRPSLFLGGVAIHDKQGQPALKLPGVAATFSWWSVMAADVRLHSLEISRPDLDIARDVQGNVFVGGIFIDTRKKSDGRGGDWILAQNEIVVRDGRLRWNDAMRDAPELALEGVTFVLRNSWQHHELALKATPPADHAAPIDIRAAFNHPHFAKSRSDFTRWDGELYADLRNADLAVWKPYIDYPFAVQKGNGAIRAWLKFDQARIADLTADLRLTNVSTRLRPDLEALNLTEVSGRISAREEVRSNFTLLKAQFAGATHRSENSSQTFGANGHAISLTDFSMQTDDGLSLPSTTISEKYVPAQNGQPEKTEVRAKSLDLRTLAEFIERLPLPAAQHQMLVEFEPRGQLRDFSAQWHGTYPNISSYSLNGEFIKLSLKAQLPVVARPKTARAPAQAALPAIPGFENLSGRVDANDRGGSFKLDAQQVRLNLPGYFANPVMPFEKLNMQAGWTFKEADQILLEVGNMDFEQDGLVASFSGKHQMSLSAQPGHPLGEIDVSGTIAQFKLKQIDRYLPLHTPAYLQAWLTGALQGGTVRDASIRLKGDLASFPFATSKPGEKPKGEFRVAGKIDNGQLLYVPGEFAKDGKAPLWPLLDKINGTLLFDRTRMEIVANSAVSHGVLLSNVKATIPDLLSEDSLLSIDGNAAGPLNELLRYTVDSPVADMIGNFTDESRALGNGRLGLKLMLPLNRPTDTKVQGTVQFGGNEVSLFNDLPPIQGVTGKLEFNERGVNFNGIKGNFLGGAMTVAGGTQRDGNIVIKAEGLATMTGLRKAYPAPAMQKLATRLSGATRYATTISIKKKRPEIIIESNLQGLALDFPAPLRKAGNELLPLKFEMTTLPGDDSGVQRDELKLALGASISARYLRQKSTEKNASWRVLRGGIGVNVPPPQPDSGLIANVNMNSLNIDDWSDAVASILGSVKTDAKANVDDALNIGQYIDPEVLAARALELTVVGKKLDNVVVGASQQRGVWQANIDSEQASGYLSWNAALPGQSAGRATARLSSLVIARSAASDVTDLLEGKTPSTQIPALDIVADNFELFGKKMGRLELVANNIQASATREWRISKLSLINADAEFKATGRWNTRDGQSLSNLNYELMIGNAGNLLTRFGFANMLRGGKGKMDGDLSWKGLPFSLDIPSLSGQFKLDMEAGQFLKVEPGAAKLLAVLNMQALPRRLTLDFRDVFSEGFAFDGINGTATISNGSAKTDNLKMRGVSATVLIDGTADIARETQNLHVVVLPEINAGAASVVYALAVNPVIGVGTFLAQLFLREPLIRAFTYEYKVTGPWQEPVVTKIDRKYAPAASPVPVTKAG